MADEQNTPVPVTIEMVTELVNQIVSGSAARIQKEFNTTIKPLNDTLLGLNSTFEEIKQHIPGKKEDTTKGAPDPKIGLMEKQLKELTAAREADQAKAARLEKESALNKALNTFQFANDVSRETAFKTFANDVQVTSDGVYVIGDDPLDVAVKGRMTHLSGLLAPKQVGGSGAASGVPANISTADIKTGQPIEYYREIFNKINS